MPAAGPPTAQQRRHQGLPRRDTPQGVRAVSHQGVRAVSDQGVRAVSDQGVRAVSDQGLRTVSHEGGLRAPPLFVHALPPSSVKFGAAADVLCGFLTVSRGRGFVIIGAQ
eukprot:COSAG01_NODE_17025_length_1184_cov_1.262673_1_plen_110_part_00